MAKNNNKQKGNSTFTSNVTNDRGPAGNTAPKTNAIAAPTIQQQTGPGSVREQIRNAGADGNFSNKELLKISDSSGRGTDSIIRSLDKVNSNRASDRQAPIGLGSAAYNNLLKTRANTGTMFGKSMADLGLGLGKYADYGSGSIGKAIMQGMSSYNYDTNSSTPGTGKIPKGQQVFGSFNGTPQLQIKPQWNVNAGYYGAGPGTGGGTPTGSPTPASTNPVEASGEETTPVIPEKPGEAKAAIEGGVGSSGFSNTLGIKKRKSSWSAKGINSKGASSLGYNRAMSNGFF